MTPSRPPLSPTDGSDIPADFPIDADLPDMTGDGGKITGPGARENGLGTVTLCGNDIWPHTPNDRLSVTSTGPEYRQSREVVTFPDAQAAVNVMTGLRQDVRACPSEPEATGATGSPTNRLHRIHQADTGYESLTFSTTLEDGSIGGEIYQFVRVGNGVLAMYRSGEFAMGSLSELQETP